MYNGMELWPTIALVLTWTGMVVGGIVTLGCLGGAFSAMLEGRANPFGKGKSEFWLPFFIGAAAAGLVYFCVHRAFLAKPGVETQEAPQASPDAPRTGMTLNIPPPPSRSS